MVVAASASETVVEKTTEDVALLWKMKGKVTQAHWNRAKQTPVDLGASVARPPQMKA